MVDIEVKVYQEIDVMEFAFFDCQDKTYIQMYKAHGLYRLVF